MLGLCQKPAVARVLNSFMFNYLLVRSSPPGRDNKLSLLLCLLALVKSSQTNIRLRERAALAVGSLCLEDGKFPHRRNLLESFIELASDIKDIELHFSIGEALVFCSLGVRSPAARDGWSVEEDDFSPLDTDLQEEEGDFSPLDLDLER